MSDFSQRPLNKVIGLSGARLMAIGLLTGLWSAAALTGKVTLTIPRLALVAHLNALLGGLWLLALASTVQYLGHNESRVRKIYRWIQIPAWSNWAITLLASMLGVTGLTYTEDTTNNVIAFLLQVCVVVPSLVGATLWVRGFSRDEA